MEDAKDRGLLGRRDFMKWSVMAAVGGSTLMACASGRSGKPAPDLIHRNERSTMTYHQLGRTNFVSSRLVFGGGAALTGGKSIRLLDRAFEVGINHYDLGSDRYYRGAERHFAPFLKAHREDIWVVSKAIPAMKLKPEENVTSDQARQAAAFWSKLLDGSLRDLGTDYVDAYYLMAVNNASLVRSEEIHNAFVKAKEAGKVGHFGVSTHQNAANVLEAMIETGWYDIAMVGITPAGWYDLSKNNLADGTPPLTKLAPILKRAENAGIGLIGMKTVRHLAMIGNGFDLFDRHYSSQLMSSPLNAFQRAYAYDLQNGLHVVNADMQNFKHLEQNIIAAATSHQYSA